MDQKNSTENQTHKIDDEPTLFPNSQICVHHVQNETDPEAKQNLTSDTSSTFLSTINIVPALPLPPRSRSLSYSILAPRRRARCGGLYSVTGNKSSKLCFFRKNLLKNKQKKLLDCNERKKSVQFWKSCSKTRPKNIIQQQQQQIEAPFKIGLPLESLRKASQFTNCSTIPSQFYMVEIRAVFLKIGDIDTLNEKFYAEVFIEAKWVDFSLDASSKYDPNIEWNPKLFVINSIGELKQEVWYNQYPIGDYCEKQGLSALNSMAFMNFHSNFDQSKILNNKTGCVILERKRLRGQFWQTLNLKHFPADVQQLTISLSTTKHSNEIKLVHCKDKSSSVNTRCFQDSQEWRLYKHITVREYIRDTVFSEEIFPSIDLTINAARRPTFYYWNAFFLIFLITISSLSTFSIRCHLNYNRIQTTSTLLLTSV